MITATQQTRNWLKQFVIAHTICPFAKREYERNSIRYSEITARTLEEGLMSLMMECHRLDTDPSCETVLLIFTQGFNCFDDFLELNDIADALLVEQGYEGTYQLASFHPDYQFADAPANDPANYTNRAPYPTLHLLREASIEAVLNLHPDPETIPERNITYTRSLGLNTLKTLLAHCKVADED